MDKTKLLLFLLFIIANATASTESEEVIVDAPENKGTGLHHYDLVVLLAILAIKFKAVILVLAIIFGFGAYSKIFSGFGGYYKSLKCPAPVVYDTPHKYHQDWNGHADRQDRTVDYYYPVYSEDMDIELLSNVMKGVGLVNPSFNITETGNCRRRLVCEADRMAPSSAVLGYTLKILRRNLTRYRSKRATRQRTDICAAIYPECRDSSKIFLHDSNLLVRRRRPPRERLHTERN